MSNRTIPDQATETDMERRGLRVALYVSLAVSAAIMMFARNVRDPVGSGIAVGVAYLGILIALAGLAVSAKKEPLR